ncbi:FtsX-like permease family protein [Devriesea agamarum]|uniref:FtsX-like permease family protein n=1 Tax=Devriesea agamarum TaxID=472569 RepID=UPI00155E2846|nr:ABC transporter permease [Devriesea agamarum]
MFNGALGPKSYRAVWSFVGIGVFLCGVLCLIVLKKAISLSIQARSREWRVLSDMGVATTALRAGYFFEAALSGMLGIILGIFTTFIFRYGYMKLLSKTNLFPQDGRIFPSCEAVLIASSFTISLLVFLAASAGPGITLISRRPYSKYWNFTWIISNIIALVFFAGSLRAYLQQFSLVNRASYSAGVGIAATISALCLCGFISSLWVRVGLRLLRSFNIPCLHLALSYHRDTSNPCHSLTAGILAFISFSAIPLVTIKATDNAQFMRAFMVLQLPIYIFVSANMVNMTMAGAASLREDSLKLLDLGYLPNQIRALVLLTSLISWILGAGSAGVVIFGTASLNPYIAESFTTGTNFTALLAFPFVLSFMLVILAACWQLSRMRGYFYAET